MASISSSCHFYARTVLTGIDLRPATPGGKDTRGPVTQKCGIPVAAGMEAVRELLACGSCTAHQACLMHSATLGGRRAAAIFPFLQTRKPQLRGHMTYLKPQS